jgi:hypothetical protein
MSFGNSNHPRNSIMKQGSVTEAFFSKNKVALRAAAHVGPQRQIFRFSQKK